MAKLAVILPHENLTDTMRMLLQVSHMDNAVIIHYDGNYDTIPTLVSQARRQGADIILTRGLIATRVRQCCDLPVVDIRMTAQELGLIIQKAKVLTMKSVPTIAIVGISNMFFDYSRLSELFHITLSSYLIAPDDPDPNNSLAEQSQMAVNDGVDVMVGGATACKIAQENGVPYIFLTSTPESLQEGLRSVKRVSYAIDMEKNNAAEIQTMLDSSFSILIRTNKDGYITNLNKAAIIRLGEKVEEIYGKSILSLVSGISRQQLQSVLWSGNALHSVFITIGEEQFVANLIPVHLSDGNIVGGVLSCDGVNRIETVSADIRREQRRLRHPAVHTFQDIAAHSEATEHMQETAKRFAISDSPVMLRHEPGCHPQVLAECIHNESPRREMPFVVVNCGELDPEEQLWRLFGYSQRGYDVARSFCALAHTGTLYLQNPEQLCSQAQNRLWRLLTQKVLLNTEQANAYPLDIRIITSTQLASEEWMHLPGFDRSLSLLLSGLSVQIPPLRETAGELQYEYHARLKKYLKKYQRYLSVTKGGEEWILSQTWPGNYIQLDSFCERLVLSAPRRSVDERLLESLYDQMVPAPPERSMQPSIVQNDEAAQIAMVLNKNLGRRAQSAKELGISTSTLWRKIRKYHLE